MNKTKQLYDRLIAIGATNPSNAITSVELAKMVGQDSRYVSTALAQVALSRKGVLGRNLETVNPGERRQYKYWVTGPYYKKGTKRAMAEANGNGHDIGAIHGKRNGSETDASGRYNINRGSVTQDGGGKRGSYIMVIVGEKVRHQEVLTADEVKQVITRNI